MASLALAPVARVGDLGFPYGYKMVNVTSHVTLPPRHIIKHTTLLNLRIDDSLAINRLQLLLICGWG